MGELIHYEQNLAACYEAEYLLSLKFQEEMKSSTYHGVDIAYPDTFEVTMKVESTNGIESHYIMENKCKIYHPEGVSLGAHESVQTPNSYPCLHDRAQPQKHDLLPYCDNPHPDGPQRKRICLQRPET